MDTLYGRFVTGDGPLAGSSDTAAHGIMRGWIDRFIDYLHLDHHRSTHTCRSYQRDLALALTFFQAKEAHAWSVLTSRDVRALSMHEFARGMSPSSIRRMLACLRTFYRYLIAAAGAIDNPAISVRGPKIPRRLPQTLTTQQMTQLLDFDGTCPYSSRDKAMMELLYSSGLQLQEMVDLDVGDLDLLDRMVQVKANAERCRTIPIGRPAISALKRWLRERNSLTGKRSGALFISVRHGRRLTTRTVQRRIAHWARIRGLTVKVHPRIFRHSFATHLLEATQDLPLVRAMLGHANIHQTEVYMPVNLTLLSRVHVAAHPRGKFKRV